MLMSFIEPGLSKLQPQIHSSSSQVDSSSTVCFFSFHLNCPDTATEKCFQAAVNLRFKYNLKPHGIRWSPKCGSSRVCVVFSDDPFQITRCIHHENSYMNFSSRTETILTACGPDRTPFCMSLLEDLHSILLGLCLIFHLHLHVL